VAKMGMMILNFDQSCLLHKQEQTTKTGPRDRGSRRAVLMTTTSITKKRQRQIIESTERRDRCRSGEIRCKCLVRGHHQRLLCLKNGTGGHVS